MKIEFRPSITSEEDFSGLTPTLELYINDVLRATITGATHIKFHDNSEGIEQSIMQAIKNSDDRAVVKAVNKTKSK